VKTETNGHFRRRMHQAPWPAKISGDLSPQCRCDYPVVTGKVMLA
jgi:hypothetical protein